MKTEQKIKKGIWRTLQKKIRKAESNSYTKHPLFEILMQRVNFLEILEDNIMQLVSLILKPEKENKKTHEI